jgi:hypothetical protein
MKGELVRAVADQNISINGSRGTIADPNRVRLSTSNVPVKELEQQGLSMLHNARLQLPCAGT